MKPQSSHYRRYPKIDSQPFRFVDSATYAYWLGFIFADASVYRGKKSQFFALFIGEKDRSHLEAFRTVAEIPNPILASNSQNPLVGIRVFDHEFLTALSKYNIVHPKVRRQRFPVALSRRLWPAFIRGYFDGDGTVYLRHRVAPNTRWTEPVCRFISGNIPLLQELKDILAGYGVNTVKIYRNQRTNAFVLPLSSKRDNIQRFYDLIYSSPGDFLARKKAIFEEYLCPAPTA